MLRAIRKRMVQWYFHNFDLTILKRLLPSSLRRWSGSVLLLQVFRLKLYGWKKLMCDWSLWWEKKINFVYFETSWMENREMFRSELYPAILNKCLCSTLFECRISFSQFDPPWRRFIWMMLKSLWTNKAIRLHLKLKYVWTIEILF